MASTMVHSSAGLLDDPKHLKAFFSAARSTPAKSYRVAAVATSDPAASEAAVSEIAASEVAASEVALQEAASEIGTGGEDRIGEVPSTTMPDTNETSKADTFGSNLIDFSRAEMNGARAGTPAIENGSPFETKATIQAGGFNPAADKFGEASLISTPKSLVNGDAHETYAIKLSNKKDEAITEWIGKTHANSLDAKVETYGIAAKFNPDASEFKPNGLAHVLADIDNLENRKKFFKAVYTKENTLGSYYKPSSAHEPKEAALLDANASDGTILEQFEPETTVLHEAKESMTGNHNDPKDNHLSNGVIADESYNSPRISGVVAPPPTPESPAHTGKMPNIPATIDEQDSGTPSLHGSRFSLSHSMHAPASLRFSTQVHKKPVATEKYALFERESFKTVDDAAGIDGTKTEAKAVTAGDGSFHDSNAAKVLPPHLRSRPTKFKAAAGNAATDASKTAADDTTVDASRIATNKATINGARIGSNIINAEYPDENGVLPPPLRRIPTKLGVADGDAELDEFKPDLHITDSSVRSPKISDAIKTLPPHLRSRLMKLKIANGDAAHDGFKTEPDAENSSSDSPNHFDAVKVLPLHLQSCPTKLEIADDGAELNASKAESNGGNFSDGPPKSPDAAKMLPPHLRSRPTKIGGSCPPVSMGKPKIDVTIAAVTTPEATKFKSDDSEILGIYTHGGKENGPLKADVAVKVKEKLMPKPPTTYLPPHKRGAVIMPKTSSLDEKREGNTTVDSSIAKKTNGATYTDNGVKEYGIKEAMEDASQIILGKSWGKPLPRESGPARHRKVVLKGLPEYSTPAFVASLVWGGPLEQIYVTGSGSQGSATFMHAEDCENYFKATSNDVKYINNGRTCHATVTLDVDVNPPSAHLKSAIEKEFTRCVKLIGVEDSFGLGALWDMAAAKARKVESIEDGKTARGTRQIVVNFCNVMEAIRFKSDLYNDIEWESLNVLFKSDPCAEATGVRTLSPSAAFLIKRPMITAF